MSRFHYTCAFSLLNLIFLKTMAIFSSLPTMDSPIPTISFTSMIISLLLFMIMAYKIIMKNPNNKSLKLPPGPNKLPIIGNIHNLFGSPLPHHTLRDLSTKYGPLMHLKLGEVSTIVVSSPEYAKEFLKTHDLNFSSRTPILASKIMSYGSKGLSFSPYGDYYRHLRKICVLELLSSKRVQSFQPIRVEELNNLIKLIASKEGSPINLSKQVFSTISTIASRSAYGTKCRYHKEFISVVREATLISGGFEIGDLYPSITWLQYVSGLKPKLEKLHREADQIMQNIFSDHREMKASQEQSDDVEANEYLLDVLLKFQDSSNQQEFQLTDDSIKAVILDIFAAGTETSATTVLWAMAEMIKNPLIMKKAQAEVREVLDKEGISGIEKLKYLKSVVKETLRLHPPGAFLLPRECGKDCEINGYHIPSKSKVIINAWAIGRDPNHWVEAERFNPERFMNSTIDYIGNNLELIPFGAGRRMCPGITFGVASTESTLAMLLYHFDWKLPNGMKIQDLDMSEIFGVAVMRKENLCLVPITSRPIRN
ncbi:cytochrome P450 71D9-like [Arachis stenosperma]|uniref:cytochrome P450 71D9-like n=1 Tax=Arachis stenosperma TaxID=217475 RepID=UPI0025AD2F07|nr:cytochrome P450 71D9-like [Arachis stenosperma]